MSSGRFKFTVCLVIIVGIVLALNITSLKSVAEPVTKTNSPGEIQLAYSTNSKSRENTPEVLEDDAIYKVRSAFVIPQYLDCWTENHACQFLKNECK
jgi:hypothetical protein